jgi:hypothetical protein
LETQNGDEIIFDPSLENQVKPAPREQAAPLYVGVRLERLAPALSTLTLSTNEEAGLGNARARHCECRMDPAKLAPSSDNEKVEVLPH